MVVYSTPGVYFERVDPARGAITALRTDISAFVGVAERGPLDSPQRLSSWEQFASAFGGFIRNGYLAYAAKAFFENGGQTLYCVRVAAPVAATESDGVQAMDGGTSVVKSADGFASGAVVTVWQQPATSTIGPQPAGRQASVVISVNGFPRGARVKVSQGTRESWRTVQLADAATGQLIWDTALDPGYDVTQPISFTTYYQADHLLAGVAGSTLTWDSALEPAFALNQLLHFETGAAAAHGDLLDETGTARLRIEATSPGAWGNGVAVRVARSNPASTRTTTATQPGDRSRSLVASVTGFQVGALVKVTQDALVTYRTVAVMDAQRKALTWNPGPLAAGYDLTRPIDFETLTFTLSVVVAGQTREIFANLSLVPAHERYVGKLWVTGDSPSAYIQVTDLTDPTAAPTWPARLPDPKAANLTRGLLVLAGGRDGIAALRPEDFTGDPAATRQTGLRALELVADAAIVAIPDILIQPVAALVTAPLPLPPIDECRLGCRPPPEAYTAPVRIFERAAGFAQEDVYRVQSMLVAHCEARKDRFALLDPPLFASPDEQADVGEIQGWRQHFDSRYAALYYPWVLVYDPLQLDGQVVRAIPPSGHVAGIYARTDLQVGVHQAPANAELAWAQGLTSAIDAEIQGVLNPLGVNCIRAFPGRGLRIYGARTVSSEAAWRYVNVRRLLMMIEAALEKATQWAVFEPNNYYTRQTLILAAGSFLTSLWERGAFAGATPEESFFVRCDEDNNPQAAVDAGQLVIDIGVAPVKPAEFVIFRLGRVEDALELTEAKTG